jgi:hypothetical protein
MTIDGEREEGRRKKDGIRGFWSNSLHQYGRAIGYASFSLLWIIMGAVHASEAVIVMAFVI